MSNITWKKINTEEGVYFISDTGLIKGQDEKLLTPVEYVNEDWRALKDFDSSYQISNLGRVKKGDKLIRPTTNQQGCKCVEITKDGTCKRYLLHRLVAKTFLDNPNDYPYIKHKDGDLENNSVENLEWSSK